MRAKPISFAQVLQSKNKLTPDSQALPLPKASLAQLFEQFEESPEEDFTLYLAPVSKAKPASFRAIASRGSNQEEVFDSWIQRQSIVSNKENVRRNPPSQLREREEKKLITVSHNREEREPLRSVADLVRKIELTESQDPYFKSNTRPTLQKSRQQQQSQRQNFRLPRQNQQSSLRSSSQMEPNQPIQIRLPEKITVQPYIQQPTVSKQPKRKEDISDIIAGTERIHLQIAQLAHQMIEEEQQQRKEMEESLLLDNPHQDHRENGKESSPSFLHTDEEKDLRWKTAKNQVDSYLRKITQEAPKQSIPRIEIIPPQPTCTKIQEPLDHPGYSFATREVEPPTEEEYSIPLEAIKIPRIQEITSERLSFENYNNYTPEHTFHHAETPIPENNCIPATKSIKFEASPEQQEGDIRSPEFQMSAKRIGSSLAFSSNRKETPSPQAKQDGNQSNSGQHHVTLSFTEEKPEIVIKIPLNYEEGEDFQMEAVEVRPEYIETPFVQTPSPERKDWENVNSLKGDAGQEEQRIPYEQPQLQYHNFYAKGAQEYITAECNNFDCNYELQACHANKQEANYYEKQSNSYDSERNKQPALVIPTSNAVPLANYEGSLLKVPLNQQPLSKIQQKTASYSPSIGNITPDQLETTVPSEPPTEPITEDCFPNIKSNKSSGSKGAAKGSPSIFGLKKIYSSPKTIPIITHPPVVTSVFTTVTEKAKVQSFESKPTPYGKSYERSSKIEPLAYGYSFTKVAVKQQPKAPIEEEENEQFKFDF